MTSRTVSTELTENTWQKITDNKEKMDGGFLAYIIVLCWYIRYSLEL